MNIPLILKTLPFFRVSNYDIDKLSLLAISTEIPAKSIATVDVWTKGQPFVLRGAAKFPNEWKVTFYNTPNLDIRQLFEEWMYNMDRHDSLLIESPFIGNYLGVSGVGLGYMTNLSVSQLCGNGNVTAKYQIYYCYPKDVSAINLNGAQHDSISTFDVTFACTYWERV